MARVRDWSNQGFTLLEIIIVLGVMSMFVLMAVPAAGRLEEAQRVKDTRSRLEEIRAAMIGHDAFDANGDRIVGGYAGDMGTLPELCTSVWDIVFEAWEWASLDKKDFDPLGAGSFEIAFENKFEMPEDEYFAVGRGQPRGLWTKAVSKKAIPPTDKPLELGQPLDFDQPVELGVRWQGPYLPAPKDELPDNVGGLSWTPGAMLLSEETENREYEMRQTEGKLADAWGRALLFYYVDEGGKCVPQGTAGVTVYIVSEGSDRKSTGPAYDESLDNNGDNVILRITPREWTDDARADQTERQLEKIREALLGKEGYYDAAGRPLHGGYIQDHGGWPDLFRWKKGPGEEPEEEAGEEFNWYPVDKENKEDWLTLRVGDEGEEEVYVYLTGQPRGLWTGQPGWKVTESEGAVSEEEYILAPWKNPLLGEDEDRCISFGWRGPYLAAPSGTEAGEVLKDAWGTPFRFLLFVGGLETDETGDVLAEVSEAEQVLTVESAGPDGEFDTEDDLPGGEIRRGDWDVREAMTLFVKLVNNTGDTLESTTEGGSIAIRFHSENGLDKIAKVSVAGKVYSDPAEAELYNQYRLTFPQGCAGYRLAEVWQEYPPDPENPDSPPKGKRLAFSGVYLDRTGRLSPGEDESRPVILTINKDI